MNQRDKRLSNNAAIRDEQNRQPEAVQDNRPGYGDKKLEGPNRPAT